MSDDKIPVDPENMSGKVPEKEDKPQFEFKPEVPMGVIGSGHGKGTEKKGKGFQFKMPKINVKDIKLSKLKTMNKRTLLWVALGIIAGMLIIGRTAIQIKNVIMGGKKEEKKMVEFADTIPVKVYKVKKMDFKDTLPVMGRIAGFKEIDLRFESNGVMESFNFEEGERILEGDIIASLNQKDALLKLKYASLELEKAKKLHELGGLDKVAYDQKSLEYESAKRDLEKTNIYAPSDGYLGSKERDAGTYVTSQDRVGIFVDYSKVYSIFDVIEEDSSKVELGQNVEIFVDAFPTETFKGAIDTISPMVEGKTRSQKVKVELENEKGNLKPGMFSRAVINTYEKKDALMIPSSAFKKKEQQYFVYVVHRDSDAAAEDESAEEEMPSDEEEKNTNEPSDTPPADNKKGINSGDEDAKDEDDAMTAEDKAEADALGKDQKESTEKEKSKKEKKPLLPFMGKDKKEDQDKNMPQAGKMPAPGMTAPNPDGAAPAEGGEEQIETGTIEERQIEIEYLTHDMAEVSKGLKEGELIVRELHQEFKDKDKVEITEVQETIF
ncbi:MAG TPA: efflux RND transporter periplasmic adaptor subunit [Candidatus Omnitrophota bacterium]|nr:efflux RND transporter periplasmic adaptor subunit [Candidatus Omnitrophota bacterium]HPS19915.1 efflux RND transporter periplasmic adaptor subunit [Candidatus Omnitrophota bacterium]